MPHYTMFNADGVPVRSEVSVDGWRLQVTGATGRRAGEQGLLAHELTHVVRNGSTVRAWLKKSPATAGRVPGRPVAQRPNAAPRAPGAFCLPEVDDEVVVTFLNATPMHTVLMYNPKEISWDKSVPWAARSSGANRGVKQGSVQVLVRQRGPQPLKLQLMACPTDAFDRDVISTRVL